MTQATSYRVGMRTHGLKPHEWIAYNDNSHDVGLIVLVHAICSVYPLDLSHTMFTPGHLPYIADALYVTLKMCQCQISCRLRSGIVLRLIRTRRCKSRAFVPVLNIPATPTIRSARGTESLNRWQRSFPTDTTSGPYRSTTCCHLGSLSICSGLKLSTPAFSNSCTTCSRSSIPQLNCVVFFESETGKTLSRPSATTLFNCVAFESLI
jgi:hypothetical protein